MYFLEGENDMLNIKIEDGKNKITLKSIRSMRVVND